MCASDVRLRSGCVKGLSLAAAQRRKNAAHGVSRGYGVLWRPAERQVEPYVVLKRCSEKRERRAFSQPLVITLSGTGSAKNFSIARYFAAEVDPFAALLGHNSFSVLYPGNSSGGSSTFTHCVVNKSSFGISR